MAVFRAANQAAMLALSTAQVGDYVARTDLAAGMVLNSLPPATLGNWGAIPGSWLPPVDADFESSFPAQFMQMLASLSATYAPYTVPTNAGQRAGQFDPLRGTYNWTPATTTRLRGILGTARAASAVVTLACVGDSKIAGHTSVALSGTRGIPGNLRAGLASAGLTLAGTGPVLCNQGNQGGGGNDSRWVLTGSWTTPGNVFYIQSGAANDQAVFTSDKAGTVIEIYCLASAAQFSYQIDGGSVIQVTPNGGNVLRTIQLTGQTNATHTVTILASTAGSYVIGANVRQTTGYQIANEGFVGSLASGVWVDGVTSHVGPVALALPCDAVLIGLGVNDARTPVTAAAFKTAMTTLIATYTAASKAVVLIVPAPPSLTDQVAHTYTWSSYVSALYDLADTLGLPLVDLTYRMQTYEIGNPLGLYFDTLHESDPGYSMDAQAIISALVA